MIKMSAAYALCIKVFNICNLLLLQRLFWCAPSSIHFLFLTYILTDPCVAQSFLIHIFLGASFELTVDYLQVCVNSVSDMIISASMLLHALLAGGSDSIYANKLSLLKRRRQVSSI